MVEKIPSIPYSELIKEQQEVFDSLVSISDARRTSMRAAGVGGSFTEISRFPGGGVRIESRGRKVTYAIKIGKDPFIGIDLGK